MTEKNNIYIEDVVDVKELQTLQDNWAKATDLAFVTVDCNGTPITKQSNFTPFCKRLRELDAFREKCYYCDACGGRKARRIGKAYVYICHAGLIDFAIPIMIKGQYVGAFLAGQVTSTDFADLKKLHTVICLRYINGILQPASQANLLNLKIILHMGQFLSEWA